MKNTNKILSICLVILGVGSSIYANLHHGADDSINTTSGTYYPKNKKFQNIEEFDGRYTEGLADEDYMYDMNEMDDMY